HLVDLEPLAERERDAVLAGELVARGVDREQVRSAGSHVVDEIRAGGVGGGVEGVTIAGVLELDDGTFDGRAGALLGDRACDRGSGDALCPYGRRETAYQAENGNDDRRI